MDTSKEQLRTFIVNNDLDKLKAFFCHLYRISAYINYALEEAAYYKNFYMVKYIIDNHKSFLVNLNIEAALREATFFNQLNIFKYIFINCKFKISNETIYSILNFCNNHRQKHILNCFIINAYSYISLVHIKNAFPIINDDNESIVNLYKYIKQRNNIMINNNTLMLF